MSSVRFKTGSQQEIQVVALNKLELNASINVFPKNGGGGGHTLGIRQPKQSLPSGN